MASQRIVVSAGVGRGCSRLRSLAVLPIAQILLRVNGISCHCGSWHTNEESKDSSSCWGASRSAVRAWGALHMLILHRVHACFRSMHCRRWQISSPFKKPGACSCTGRAVSEFFHCIHSCTVRTSASNSWHLFQGANIEKLT